MNSSAFIAGAAGDLVDIVESGVRTRTSVPLGLPVERNLLTREVVMALSDADAELGRLDGRAINLPDSEMLNCAVSPS